MLHRFRVGHYGRLGAPQLPLADPLPDSLGRLFGQYPALTYVDCADDVRMPFVATHLATEPVPRGTVVWVCVAAIGIGAMQRSIGGRRELHPAAFWFFLVPEERSEHAPPLIEDRAVEATLLADVLAGLFEGTCGARRHVPHPELLQPVHAVAL